MFKRIFLIALWVLFLINAGATQVSAMTDHSHHQGAKQVSPFEGKPFSMHCLLKGHLQQGFCPDHLDNYKGKKENCLIGCECGGSPFPKNKALINIDFTPLENPMLQVFVPTGYKKATPVLGQLHSAIPDAVKPPPKIS